MKEKIRLCIKCNKRKGFWWDYLCDYCRNRPTSEKEALEYDKINDSRGIYVSEQDNKSLIDDDEVGKQKVLSKKSWWQADSKWLGGYIVAGAVWYYSKNFMRTSVDGLIVLIIAISAGFFYYRLKSKIKIKNEAVKIVIAFIITEIIAVFLIGILTVLI